MGLIQNLLAKRRLDREQFKNMQRQKEMGQVLGERDKSSDQREIERFVKRDQEKSLKYQLEEFRRIEKEEIRLSNPIFARNIVAGGDDLLRTPTAFEHRFTLGGNDLFTNNRSFLMR